MSVDSDFARSFEREVGRPLRAEEPLHLHSSFRIGGPADFYFRAETLDDLGRSVLAARGLGVRHAVIGGGFNLLFDDEGFRGLIIQNAAAAVRRASADPILEAASGTPLEELVAFAAGQGLGGLEFLAGIPGTVGGAVYGNAGAFGRSTGDLLERALLLGSGGTKIRAARDYFGFGYRHSRLKSRPEILLRAEFLLRPAPPDAIRAAMQENLSLRAQRHPGRSAAYPGSYFKNPLLPDGCKQAAGALLEQAGARGLRAGGAAVYEKHCNFIINEGGATARDVRALAARMKKRVLDKFGITLEEEVIFLPAAAAAP